MEGFKRLRRGTFKNSPPLVSVGRGSYLGQPLRVSSKRLHPTRVRLCGDRSEARIICDCGGTSPNPSHSKLRQSLV
jgi:hypothetical protein